MTKKTTAQDVAKAAGVSPATVSLVFHNRPGVKAQTRELVWACAKELGYEYGGAASPTEKTSTLLLIVFKRHGNVISNTQFFEHLIRGVSDETYRLGYHRLSVTYFYAQENIEEQLESIRSVKCAGAILLATEMRARDVEIFKGLGVPLVLLDNWFASKAVDSVMIDNARGVKSAIRYLRSAGHTEIGYLHCSADIKNFKERAEAFLAAERKQKERDADPVHYVVELGSSIPEAYQTMNDYLDGDPYLPTAFFADNDYIATFCIRSLKEHGYRVPEDISVIGFDDIELAPSMDPPLTTMHIPQESMGELAAKRLADLIEGHTKGLVHCRVQPELVARGSVCPPADKE